MPPAPPVPPVALTIAGLDPSSGAGITADLKTFAAHTVYGTACATALTVQTTRGVFSVHPTEPLILRATLQALEEDLPPAGIKIGMLAEEGIVAAVCDHLETVRGRRQLLVILDPVLRSSSGRDLLSPAGQELLRDRLLPLCTTVTPNREELVRLLGPQASVLGCSSSKDLITAARQLRRSVGGLEVIVTGGDSAEPTDLVLAVDDSVTWLRGQHIESRATHGTGCAFASALLCHRLLGEDLLSAARNAKHYVERAILTSPPLGTGRGPLHHLWPLTEEFLPSTKVP